MDTSPTIDANATVIMRSAGTSRGVTKTLEVVIRRAAVPALSGAVNIAGLARDTVIDASTLDIDGRDYSCAGAGASCDDPSSWTVTAGPLKYGIVVPRGAEAPVEAALASPAQRDAVKGKNRTDPSGTYTSGRDTVAGDDAPTAARIEGFVSALASNTATTVLESTRACQLVGAGGGAEATTTATLANGCGWTSAASLGSRERPRVVFVRGDIALDRSLKGAGVLVVQDGHLTSRGTSSGTVSSSSPDVRRR